jgi:hypothetical protein
LAGIDGVIDSDLELFNRPPKMIPNKHHRCLIVVIRKSDGSALDKDHSGIIPSPLKGTLNIPSVWSANESETPLQDFYCLTATNDLLCSNYQGGLLLNNESNSYEQIDEVVKKYSSARL